MSLDVLTQSSISELARPTQTHLVSITADTSIDVAMKTMLDKHILSAPVAQPNHGGFTSFVDLCDCLLFLFQQLQENSVIEGGATRLLNTAAHFQVADVASSSHRYAWMPVQADTAVLNAIALMSSNGTRRVPVVARDGTIFSVLTESDVVRFLHTHAATLPAAVTQVPIRALAVMSSPVRAIHRTDQVMQAFHTMVRERLSGLAVLHDDGTLAGNISLSDLKHLPLDVDIITRSHFTVEKYLSLQEESGGSRRRDPICLTFEDTFADVLRSLVEHRIHRVYIVRPGGIPTAVISLADVLANVLALVNVSHIAPAAESPQSPTSSPMGE